MNQGFKKVESYAAIGLCLALLLRIIYKTILCVYAYTASLPYKSYEISEFMINYQGGFVRRGLTGELLYRAFQIHPFSVLHFVLCFDVIAFVIFAIIIFHICRKKQWIPVMPIALINGYLFWYRRDFFMIVISFAIFYLLFQYLRNSQRKFLIAFSTLSSLSILIYEPSFFFTIPISMLFYFCNSRAENFKQKIIDSLKVFCLPLLCMFIVCKASGNGDTADRIWNSWQPLFDYQGIPSGAPGDAINFMNMTTGSAMKFHLRLNFGISKGRMLGFSPSLVVGSMLMFIGIYFLTITIPSLKRQTKECRIALSYIFIFQIICLLPMFTVLSCDFGRTINYVIYSTLFLTYAVEKYQIRYEMPVIRNLSNKVYLLCSNPICSNLLVYLTVLLLTPFTLWGGVSILNPLCKYYMGIFLRLIGKIHFLISGL